MSSDTKNDKTYKERKELLRQEFHKITEHPAYRDKTYKGDDFRKGLLTFEDKWFDLIYHCSDFNRNYEYKDHTSFEYKLCRWSHWSHNFNHALFRMHSKSEKQGVDVAFAYPEFLDGLFDVTYKFLNARTREEESKTLDTTYRIIFFRNEVDENGKSQSIYKVRKYTWITEENLGVKSELLPMYISAETQNLFKKRTKKDWEEFRNKINKGIDESIKDSIVNDEKETLRLARLAAKKGIIVNTEEPKK